MPCCLMLHRQEISSSMDKENEDGRLLKQGQFPSVAQRRETKLINTGSRVALEAHQASTVQDQDDDKSSDENESFSSWEWQMAKVLSVLNSAVDMMNRDGARDRS